MLPVTAGKGDPYEIPAHHGARQRSGRVVALLLRRAGAAREPPQGGARRAFHAGV
ncbi:MAG TPA: hypothetical protein DCE35_07990, partial [Alcanivorax sp.]|nr:hypothetical protein [Alcanivorax sp.]